ncbi:MAG: FKBP-type peptidyl-prolyl cis-trans isomerase [Bacteroidota bacterium]
MNKIPLRTSAFILLLGVCTISCSLDTTNDAEAIEQIEAYISANGLMTTQTTNGVYVEVQSLGTGDLPSLQSVIRFHFRGFLLDGREWITTYGGDPIVSFLVNVAPFGLQEGLATFGQGGKGTLLMPPSLGYGNDAISGVPANSPLRFEIEMIDIFENLSAFDQAELEDYIEQNELNAQRTDSGLFYTVDSPGDDNKPSITDRVRVNYRGYFLNGAEFDSNNDFEFELSQVIPGWREGIPLYGVGGKGTLLIPSALAYGPEGNNVIPPNTPILFDIELLEIIE